MKLPFFVHLKSIFNIFGEPASEVEVVEVSERVIKMKLSGSLLRSFMASIEKVQVVSACHCDSKTLIISFIESLSHASVVVKVHASVMHKLYSSLLKN